MTFFDRFNELLQERNLDKNGFVKATGISKSAYYRYIARESEPTLAAVITLADFFNVSVDYLIGRSNTPTRLP